MSVDIDLSDFLRADAIADLTAKTKSDAIDELCAIISKHPHVTDSAAFRDAMIDRERLLSTGIGLGIAVPHVKIPSVRDYVIAVGRVRHGIEFESIDGEPVQLVFMIGASEHQARGFVQILARVVRLAKDDERRRRLLEADLPDEFLEIVRGSSLSGES